MPLTFRTKGYLHYEHIPARGYDHQYRVADEGDDVVADFPTEEQAIKFVDNWNKEILLPPAFWKGHPVNRLRADLDEAVALLRRVDGEESGTGLHLQTHLDVAAFLVKHEGKSDG